MYYVRHQGMLSNHVGTNKESTITTKIRVLTIIF